MRTTNSHTLLQLMIWQLPNIAKFSVLTLLVVGVHQLTGIGGIVPAAPITVLGGAIGIYVSFRTQSAYDRWWEGRKLWGQLVNTSRHFAYQALAYVPQERSDPARRFVLLQILYVHVLRCSLRVTPLAEDEDVRRVAQETQINPKDLKSNASADLVRIQLHDLTKLNADGRIDAWRLQSLDASLRVLLDVQGGCERILNTPLPPGYGFISEILIRSYAVLLPLSLLDDLGWLALPVTLVVCLALKLISEVGRVLEDPFSQRADALPLLALSRTIERDLRESLNVSAPKTLKPDTQGVLM